MAVWSFHSKRRECGLTLVELLLSLTIGAMLLAGLTRFSLVIGDSAEDTLARQALLRQARFALSRMQIAVCTAEALLTPSADDPRTIVHVLNAAVEHREDIREQSVPADPAEPFATAVLALVLADAGDFDRNGVANTDNDADGNSNEDTSADMSGDGAPGIVGIDDDGDGLVDEGLANDDDEDGLVDEDPPNGIDDDLDGRIDEDYPADADGDGDSDDDSDGLADEDFIDTVVFYLSGDRLLERRPSRDPASGTDYLEHEIGSGLTALGFRREADDVLDIELVNIALTMVSGGNRVTIDSTSRIGCNL